MICTKSTNCEKMSKTTSPKSPSILAHPYAALSMIGLLSAIAFFPVTRLFFAQDDFILMAGAAFGEQSSLADFFGSGNVQFRPLTKFLYFKVMYGLFGLNPVPYHWVSVVFHLVNVFLVHRLLGVLRIGRETALLATAVFALHAGFVDVVGWISCIQQLAALTFMIVATTSGIEWARSRRIAPIVIASISYILALASMEQVVGLPLILTAYVLLESTAKTFGKRLGEALKAVTPLLVIMVAYLILFAAGKGAPKSGPYEFHYGFNIVANLLTYLDWVLNISVLMPYRVNADETGLTIAHLVIAVIAFYNAARGRGKLVVFSFVWYAVAIAPVLLLKNHTFYLHNYIPAPGIIILIAPVIGDFVEMLAAWRPRLASFAGPVLVAVLAVMCFTKVRANEKNYISPSVQLQRHFVTRRAIIAKNMFDDISQKTRTTRSTTKLHLVYQGGGTWYNQNVLASIGRENGPRLLFDNPDLEVIFHTAGDTIEGFTPADSEVLYFDMYGRCLTRAEIEAKSGR
jgi:hypothetical protein